MSELAATIERALDEAHIPSLLMCLVHLTGDASHLTGNCRPVYRFRDDGQGNLTPEQNAWIKSAVKDALLAHLEGAKPLPSPPSPDTVRHMLDWIAGRDVPERYLPYVSESLGLEDVDVHKVGWDDPRYNRARKTMNVVVIGAGLSGMIAAIRLKEAGLKFTVIEKNAEVGGTWLENSYPGARVDSSNYVYSYSFDKAHEWPYFFSTRPVLLKYFQEIAERFDIRRFIRFQTRVIECRYDEASATWAVTIEDLHGRREVLTATVVITAMGQLNQPMIPPYEGQSSFTGEAFHSAQWRHDVDLRGKRVAVVGTGPSAFQIVPEIATHVKQLTVFQRNPPWLGPTPHYHHPVGDGKKWLLQHLPFYARWYRFWLLWLSTDGAYYSVKADPSWTGDKRSISAANDFIRDKLTAYITSQLEDAPHLIDKVVPTYPYGGKRAVRDNGVWLAALKRPNAELVTEGIEKFTPDGIVTKDGTSREIDVVIYATGFHASRFLHPIRVTGKGGLDLHRDKEWDGDARAYLGITTPDFPNFFVLYGPNTNINSAGNIFFFSERGVRYIIECLRLMADTGSDSIEVRQDVHDAYNRDVDELNAQMAWGQPQVSSWYKNAKGRVTQNWPWPMVEYWWRTLRVEPSEFTLGRRKQATDAKTKESAA